MNADQHRLGAIEHQAIFDQVIKPRVFSAAQPVARPVAIIFGGQPGSGKSASVELAEQELALRGGCVEIIGDDFREFHPGFGGRLRNDDKSAAFYTDRDTGQWVEKAIAHAKELRANIVIEGTMRDTEKVAQTRQSLRAAGWMVVKKLFCVGEFWGSEHNWIEQNSTKSVWQTPWHPL